VARCPPLLPYELQLAVIDNVDDSHCLENCSRVCKSWTAPARTPLFSALTLQYGENSSDSLLKLLPHTSALANCVRHVTIIGSSGTRLPTSHLPREVWFSHAIQAVARLPHLKSLALHHVTWTNNALDALFKERPQRNPGFKSVESLELLEFHFGTSSELLEFLGHFQRLRKLVLTDSKPFRDPPSGGWSSPSLLDHIILDTFEFELNSVFQGMVQQLSSHSYDLVVRLGHHPQSRYIQRLNCLLSQCSDNLKRITLDFSDWIPAPNRSLPVPIDLSKNSHLQSISFRGLHLCATKNFITSILSHIRSPITHLSIGIICSDMCGFGHFCTPSSFGQCSFSQLDAALRGLPFTSSLEALCLRVVDTAGTKRSGRYPGQHSIGHGWASRVRSCMPWCYQRGILSLSGTF
jgi:hypothetical protein